MRNLFETHFALQKNRVNHHINVFIFLFFFSYTQVTIFVWDWFHLDFGCLTQQEQDYLLIFVC